jgi:hypothetical protein
MKTATLKSWFVGAALLAGGSAAVQAQQYSIGWSTIAGGAATASGGQYSASSTVGQVDAGGPSNGGQFALNVGFWESAAGGSVLSIRYVRPNEVELSWPAPAVGCFVLQQTTALTTNPLQAHWADVPTAVTYNNGVNQVVLTITASAMFYRLVSPCL